MRSRTIIALAIVALLTAALLVMPGPGPLAVAGPVEPAGEYAPASIISVTCNSCSDCTTKLQSGSYATVTLITNITDYAGTCISFPTSGSGVVFDCAGHTIDGVGSIVDSVPGVAMNGTGNTIQNCTIREFDYGIRLWNTTNNVVTNNTVTSNGAGIRLGFSNSNNINNNTVSYNINGIYVSDSDNNTIDSNTVCNNTTSDFNIISGTGNSGDNNTCLRPDGWNDDGTTGCTYMCAGATTCSSCSGCTSSLDGTFDTVLLIADISNHPGTCITFGANDVVFDCGGHKIDGDDFGTDYGFFMSGRSGNTVKNCVVTDFQTGINLMSSSGITISNNEINSNSRYGINVGSSSSNQIYSNDVIGNQYGIKLWSSDSNTLNFNEICSNPGPDFYFGGGSSSNSGDNNTCDDPDGWKDDGRTAGCTYRCSTCSDGTQNGDEEGVDCGGTYCPPCSQCSGEPTTKYAPHDTVCQHKWPTSDGPDIGMNTESDSCNLVEVCDPNLDYIVDDALLCCEYEGYSSRLSGDSDKIAACSYAHTAAYGGGFLDFRDNFNSTTLKQCLAHYMIRGFGQNAVYMQGYFHGEFCCYGSGDFCPSGCSKWRVNPAAWEMGTSASCAGPGGTTPDFQMGGHRCEYRKWWLFGWHYYGKHGYWHSDTNWHSNSDSAADIPAHASIRRLSTGTCVDYSFSLTTMLRKAGYSKDQVLSVNGEGHGYNLVKFPGEAKWHYVDAVGNTGGGVYGGSGFPDPKTAWYHYCCKLDDGCSNDVYTQSRSRCPSNNMIYGCEGVARSSSISLTTTPPPMVEIEPAPGCQYASDINKVADETCTELEPCTGEFTATVQAPGPTISLEVSKTLSSGEIVLGEGLGISVDIENKESESVKVIARETFIPGVAYDLEAQEGAYEGFHFQFHDWSLELPAQSTKTVTFTAVPTSVGHYSFMPTSVFTGGSLYRTSSPTVTVVCDPNGTCDKGENYIFCPQDCNTGIQDDFCDMVADGTNDPDCEYGVDPDYNSAADTDGDGVTDGTDECPLTSSGEFVDSSGCSCPQKICDDQDPSTIDACDQATASCTHVPDADQDGVADSGDNCPAVYNPGQTDSDGDGKGDECEIEPVGADITLDGGTYYISAPDGSAAITITASNVVLDCNGATIIGAGSGYGICVPDNINNVTIRNCNVRNYKYGIYVESSGNQLVSNTLETNSYGIVLGSSSANTVTNNVANSNTYAGVYLEGSADNRIISNTVNSNKSVGVFIHTSPNNEVSENYVCGNTNSDFDVYDSANNTGSNNTCSNPDDWNDDGTTGCSSVCKFPIYLPTVLRNFRVLQ